MMATKEELEFHRRQYFAFVDEANSFNRQGNYAKALESAVSALEHIDGMMQFIRKYESKGPVSIEALAVIFKLAPLLFEYGFLNKVEILLISERRISKISAEDLQQGLAQAKGLMGDCRRLWNHIELHPNCEQADLRQSLGGDQNQWRNIAEFWEQNGFISHHKQGTSVYLTLKTRMQEPVTAKCPACGSIVKAPKVLLLEPAPCPHCHHEVSFVFRTEEVALSH
jgi:hypothetical protein